MLFLISVLYSQALEPALYFSMASQQRDQPTLVSGGQGDFNATIQTVWYMQQNFEFHISKRITTVTCTVSA